MNIHDENQQYQGYYSPLSGIFTQSQQMVSLDSIRITKDVIDTLELQGCKFIEAVILKQGGHIEPYYITFDRFMEVAMSEYNHEKQRFELVYTPVEIREPDERQEVRSNLLP